MDFNAWRRRCISEPAYRWARNAMSPLSAAETALQAAQLEEAEAMVARVLQVDDFAPEALSPDAG